MLTSSLCKQEDFSSHWFTYWIDKYKGGFRMHRKAWEHMFITQALYERSMLQKGKRGLGFAVGTEPLPSMFASYGVKIIATDLDTANGIEQGWNESGQLCEGIDALYREKLCSRRMFDRNVEYKPVNMNDIPDDLVGYDFNWSSCSFEHLGSIQKGIDFIVDQMKTLKQGGVAVHTTEFNISSNNDTLESSVLSIFRRCDIERIVDRLTELGHKVEPLDFAVGDMEYDVHYDVPPYSDTLHVKLLLHDYVCTSIGLIITKGNG